MCLYCCGLISDFLITSFFFGFNFFEVRRYTSGYSDRFFLVFDKAARSMRLFFVLIISFIRIRLQKIYTVTNWPIGLFTFTNFYNQAEVFFFKKNWVRLEHTLLNRPYNSCKSYKRLWRVGYNALHVFCIFVSLA